MEDETTANEIYDSLPYFDNDLEQYPNLKALVDKEFAKVPKPPNKLHPKVPPAPTLFANNPLLAAELERVERHEPFPPLDTIRYQVPAPLSSDAGEEEWKQAVDNARSQFEQLRIRQANTSLLQNYGANAWRVHNYLLEADAVAMEKQAEKLKEEVTEVNRERKNFQTQIGAQITALERRWTDLISNVLQIELANIAMEAEIQQLEAKEAELQGLLPASSS